MTQSTPPRRLHWTQGDLYQRLMWCFPEHRTKQQGVLDIPRLSSECKITQEGFYKWLRTGRLQPANARTLVDLANRPENIAALAKLERQPPTIPDFATFVFA